MRALVSALESLAGKNVRLIASAGLPTWELAAYLGGKSGLGLELIVPGRQDNRGREYFAKILRGLGLDPQNTRPVFTGSRSTGDFYAVRDRMALELAEVVYPVSIRPGGRLDTLLAEFLTKGKQVRQDFRIKFSRAPWTPSYSFPMDKLNPKLRLFESGWLTHWTHTWPGAWPGEEPREFYRDLLADPANYVRDARATLARIISEGLLRGSSWKMPSGESAISFTALTPAEAIELMRWRKRYARYSLEPYGLAFRQESLERAGTRPVRYLRNRDTVPSGEERLFTQSAGRKGNWTVEKEWRLRGNLKLEEFAKEELVLVTADLEDSVVFQEKFDPPWEVISLFS